MYNPHSFKKQLLKKGFYKFIKVLEPLATVDYKADLQLDTYKERLALDLVALYHPQSVYPKHIGSLVNRIIWVKAVYKSDNSNVISHAEWTFILNREDYNQVLVSTSPDSPVLETQPKADAAKVSELSQDDMLRAYFIAKADPNIQLADDDGTGDDLPDDNSDTNEWYDGE